MNWFNINTRAGKIRFHNYIERQMLIFDRYMFKKMARFIKNKYKESAKMIRKGDLRIENVIYKNKELYSMMMTYYHRISTHFSNLFAENIDRLKRKDLLSVFWPRFRNWVTMYCANRVKVISDTTIKQIKRIIKVGVGKKLTNYGIAKEITKLAEIESKFRADKIVRTETHTMSTKTMHEMAKEEIEVQEKEWSSANDERTRESHVTYGDVFAESGEPIRIGIDESFYVSGEYLDYPGDPKGSGKNVINCRCVLLYYTRGRVPA